VFSISGKNLRGLYTWFKPESGKLSLLTGSSIFTALAEAAVLSALVPLVGAIGGRRREALNTDLAGFLTEPIVITVEQLLVVCVAAIVIRFCAQLAVAFLTGIITSSYEARLRKNLFRLFLRASWRLQSQESMGRLQASMSTNIARSARSCRALVQIFVCGSSVVILLGGAVSIDWVAALCVFGFAGILFCAMQPVTRAGMRYAEEQTKMNTIFASQVAESVVLAREIRIFNVRKSVTAIFGKAVERNRFLIKKGQVLRELITIVYQNSSSLAVIAALGIIFFLGNEHIEPLIAVALLSVRAFSYGQHFQSYFHQFSETLPYLYQVRSATEEYGAAQVPDEGGDIERVDRISFESVFFSYQQGSPVLEGIDLNFVRGRSFGIIGPSGSGKTTLVQLLLRLYEPLKGQITVNGDDVRGVSLRAWYDQVAYVPQEPNLFRGTIAENIRFFRGEIPEERIQEAAQLAGIHEDVMAMREGYETDVSERGGRLSGGQRQRICIARALAGTPSVLIMDEPTSSLDYQSDALIKETLSKVKGELTTIVVAHRLSTLDNCDEVIVIRGGTVEAVAAPRDLLISNVYYQDAVEGEVPKG